MSHRSGTPSGLRIVLSAIFCQVQVLMSRSRLVYDVITNDVTQCVTKEQPIYYWLQWHLGHLYLYLYVCLCAEHH